MQGGVRIDFSTIDATTGEEKWVDVMCTHEASSGKQKSSLAHCVKRRLLAERGLEDEAAALVPPAIKEAVRYKTKKYKQLVDVAKRQFDEGTFDRVSVPTFVPFVITFEGRMNAGASDLLESIFAAYKSKVAALPPRRDGVSNAHLLADFKKRVLDSLACANAKGVGQVLRAAGRQRLSRRRG